jgi:hypothetical protein
MLDIFFLCAHPALKTHMQGLVALDFFALLTVACNGSSPQSKALEVS